MLLHDNIDRNARQGCKEQYGPKEENRHLANCRFQLIRCLHHDVCSEKISINQMGAHLEQKHQAARTTNTSCTVRCDLGTDSKVLKGCLMGDGADCVFVYLVRHKDSFKAVMTFVGSPGAAEGMAGTVSMFRPDRPDEEVVLVSFLGPMNGVNMCSKKSFDQLSGLHVTQDFAKKYCQRGGMVAKFKFELGTEAFARSPTQQHSEVSGAAAAVTNSIDDDSFLQQLQAMSLGMDAMQQELAEKNEAISSLKKKNKALEEKVAKNSAPAASGGAEVAELKEQLAKLRDPRLRAQGITNAH